MLNQRKYKVSFIRAWSDFLKNIFNFKGYTTRKGYWSVRLPLILVSFILVIIFSFAVYNVFSVLPSDEESVKSLQLLLMTDPQKFLNPDFMVSKFGLSQEGVVFLNQALFILALSMIIDNIIIFSTLSLVVRRIRDVGFSKNGITTLLVLALILKFLAFPQFQLIRLIYLFFFDIVVLCFKSRKYSSKSTDSSFRKFFYVEENAIDEE